jgi:hypothetical protein
MDKASINLVLSVLALLAGIGAGPKELFCVLIGALAGNALR